MLRQRDAMFLPAVRRWIACLRLATSTSSAPTPRRWAVALVKVGLEEEETILPAPALSWSSRCAGETAPLG